MKTTSICRRCHRLKPVDLTRCCATCKAELREMEKPKTRSPEPETTRVEISPPQGAAPPPPVRSAFQFIEPNLD